MYVDIINSPKSKFTYESEVKTLWVSLLFAQSVVLGGRSTFRMALENYLKTAAEKAKIATLQDVIDNWFDEEIQRDFAKDVNDYKMHIAIKQKSKKDLLLLTIDRWGFKIHQDLVVKTNRDYLQNVKLLNLFPLVSDNRTGIYNLYFNNSSKDKIRYAVIILKGLKDNFILDKTIFDNVPAIGMNEADREDTIKALSADKFTFLYGELMSLPLLYDLTTDRFNAVREYFIKGSESFDETFIKLKKENHSKIFSTENFSTFSEVYRKLKNEAFIFNKLDKENSLLQELYSNSSVSKKIRIHFAVTSKKNMNHILKKLDILDERESLYVNTNLCGKVDLNTICSFFIADDR